MGAEAGWGWVGMDDLDEDDDAVVVAVVDIAAVSGLLKGYVLGSVNQENSVFSPSSHTLKKTSTDNPSLVGVT